MFGRKRQGAPTLLDDPAQPFERVGLKGFAIADEFHDIQSALTQFNPPDPRMVYLQTIR